MQDRKKHMLHSVLFTFALCVLFMASGVQASAAAGTQTLNAGKTYKSFDLTGDGKKDTVTFQAKETAYCYSELLIYVNGKLAYDNTELKNHYSYSVELKLIRLKNGKTFLYMYAPGDNGDGPCVVLQYKKGALKEIIDLTTLMKGYGNHENGSVKSVSGNKVVFSVHLMSYELGAGLVCNMEYKYQSGTLKRAGSTAKIEKVRFGQNSMTAGKSFTAYKEPGSKTAKFKVQAGQKVTFPRIWLKNKKMWVEVKVNGKTGWIEAAKKGYTVFGTGGNPPKFKEVTYAG